MEDLIFDLDLLDLPLKNGKYTWSNRRLGAGYIATMLDRFLVSASFLLRDLNPASFTFPSVVSDHKPVSLVLATSINLGPIPFYFNSSWIQEEKSMGLVKNTWGLACTGSPSYIWESKLRKVCSELKV